MDIWEELFVAAKDLYKPQYTTKFIYSHHVASAIEADNGDVFTGFCIRSSGGVANLCAERVAAINMFVNGGRTVIKRMVTVGDGLTKGQLTIPCGACREFLMQLSTRNSKTEILTNYFDRKIVTLGELIPYWWGYDKLD